MPSPTEAQRLQERVRPERGAVMFQRWAELLFLHWSWDPDVVQRTLPPGLTVDTYDGRAWIGLVPFFMQAVRPRFCPTVPGLSDFLELNVRTYVHDDAGRPGVWFYSLDCNQWLAVKVARGLFHLPYEHAGMSARRLPGGGWAYVSQRQGDGVKGRFEYASAAQGQVAAPGTREFFLLERYRLYSHDARRNRLLSGRVAHRPYRFQLTETTVYDDRVLTLAGFDPAGRPPEHACVAEAVDVEVFPLERVQRASG
ncbi:MAG TPA: DUF2071 domain-containing protein [Opitutaceae bacterium]